MLMNSMGVAMGVPQSGKFKVLLFAVGIKKI
jgi:hypothetical protein